MKKIHKSIMVSAMTLACVSSLAQSSGSGVDPSGEGVINLSFTSIGSCTAPTMTVDLGSIDFHTAKNGATGVYEQNIELNVVCSNPNQHWGIANHTASFEFNSGVNGQSTEPAFVSVTGRILTPGTTFKNDPIFATDVASFWMIGGGATTSALAKLTFGKSLPDGTIANERLIATDPASHVGGGVPMGTIDGRGAFTVDIPLEILY